MQLIDWLNANSAAVQALATVMLVMPTPGRAPPEL